MNRTLATFHVLHRRYGDAERIRVGKDAYRDYDEEVMAARYRTERVAPYGVGTGSNFRFRGARVELDPALAPHEVAWDVAKVSFIPRGLEDVFARLKAAKRGDVVPIPSGHHVLTFENGMMKWVAVEECP